MWSNRKNYFNLTKPKDKFYIFNTTINHFHSPKENPINLNSRKKMSCMSKPPKLSEQRNNSGQFSSPAVTLHKNFTSSFLSTSPQLQRSSLNKATTSDRKSFCGKNEKQNLRAKTEQYDYTIKKKLDQQEIKNNIIVAARFRPFSTVEIELNNSANLNESPFILNGNTVMIKNDPAIYTFDKVFKRDDTQSYIYECIGKQTVKDILDGYNGTIFTYGNTNSGKTYTMFGDDIESPEMMGIIPRIGMQIFSFIEQAVENVEFEIRCSILEIYKENLRDLLNKDNNNLKIKESPARGIFVDGLSEPCVSNLEEMLSIILIGQQQREVGSTRLNEHSSRSHAIFIMQISQKLVDGSEKKGILNLIDLAGSENVSKSGAEGKSLEEAKKINLSLSALCNVIHALTSNSDHIPYRDSKLTRLLQESLGGNYKTSLIITCSSHTCHLPETISSLKFGKRAKAVKNAAKINIQKNENCEIIIQSLKAELDIAKKEIFRLRNGSDEGGFSYPSEILLSPLQSDTTRVSDIKYKTEIESLKSDKVELQNRIDDYISEIKTLKKDKFNSEKKLIEFEQIINSYKLKEINSSFEIKKNNIELEIYKKEIASLSEAFNEIEIEMYKSLKEKKSHLLTSSKVIGGQSSEYLGKHIIEDGANNKSFISSFDAQKQFEEDRKMLTNIIEISLDENALLRKSKHSNELFNSIEEASVPKDVIVHLYKNSVIDLIIYNHCLQRMIVSLHWRQIIECSKSKVKHELHALLETQLKQVEDMLDKAHYSQNKLLRHIEKYTMDTSLKDKANTSIIKVKKANVKKTMSKVSYQCFRSYQSSKNASSYNIPSAEVLQNPIPSNMHEALAQIKEQQEMIGKMNSAYCSYLRKNSEEHSEFDSFQKHMSIDESNDYKSKYMEIELKYQTERSTELKKAWDNSQMQTEKLKKLVSSLQEKNEISLKEEITKWSEIITSLKSNYESELLRKQQIISKLHGTLGVWINRYNECMKKSNVGSSQEQK